MNQANDTLNNINSKRNELKNLTENIKKYSELNELLPKQIEKVSLTFSKSHIGEKLIKFKFRIVIT